MDFYMRFVLMVALMVITPALSMKHFRNTLEMRQGLTTSEKMKLALAKIAKPSAFKGAPADLLEVIQEYSDYPSIDNYFIDARELFLQTKKISDTQNLPELKWGWGIAFCNWWFCIDLEINYSTANSHFVGGDQITSKTDISPDTIVNTLNIPHFNWTSPGFSINITDYLDLTHHYTNNSYYSVENSVVAFTTNYEYMEGVGIQIANLSVFFKAGKVRGGVQEWSIYDFNGNLHDSGRYDLEEYPMDEGMNSNWNWAERGWTQGMEYRMNCFLSQGRSDVECYDREEGDDELRDYYRFLNVQLIQALGLGALVS